MFAFPRSIEHTIHPQRDIHGMELRDYFAAHALIGLIIRNKDEVESPTMLADQAYKLANRMIAIKSRGE